MEDRRSARWLWVVAAAIAVVAGLLGAASARTTRTLAASHGYDAPAIARVDVHQIVAAEASQSQLSAVLEVSASTPVVGNRPSTTSPRFFIVTNTVEGVDLSLKYKPGWSAEQVAAADGKVASLNQAAQNGELSLTSVERSGTSAASRYKAAGNSVPTGADVDHVIDLQLGGADAITNMSPLNASVNRSLGAQIACQLSGMPVGTAIRSVSIC